jgi:enamine deaminase RidA (YjgF/YER057c/UK114 family)
MRRDFINIASSDSKKIAALEDSNTPAAFSDAVRVETGDAVFLYISGQTPIDDDGKLIGDSIGDQTRQVLRRIERILNHQGAAMTDIVRVRVYVTDISADALRQVHEARNEFFPAGNRPASTLVEISGIIRDGAMIEIDAEAVMPS